MFSSRCGAISGRLRVCRQPLAPRSRRPKRLGSKNRRSALGLLRRASRVENARLARRPTRASRLPPRRRAFRRPNERPRAKSSFFPHFVSIQCFARRKISASVATPIPRFARSAIGRKRRRLASTGARRSLASPHAGDGAVALGCSPRSERCHRRSRAGSETREVKSGRPEDPSTYPVFQKDKSTNLPDAFRYPAANALTISVWAKSSPL
jgi:hypothetical protein